MNNLEIIVCPLCKGKLHLNKHKNTDELVCNFDKLAFPIKKGVPIMLADEARIVRPGHES